MTNRRTAVFSLIILFAFSLACGGGGDKTPSATFRTLHSSAQAIKGQYVAIEIQLSNFPTTATWTLFADNDLDYDNGANYIDDDNSAVIKVLWDTTSYLAGLYNIGVVIFAGTETYIYYASNQVEVIDGVLPEVTISSPVSGGLVDIGTDMQISASCTNFSGFEWELIGSLTKKPLSPGFVIAEPTFSNPLNYLWDTAGLYPSSFYIGAIARKGDVLSYSFTPFLVTLSISDYWVSMSTVNAPTSRYDHKAIWTGTKFIVWGGREGNTILNDGSAYSPWSDSWEALSDVGAPVQAEDETVTWCGDRMIVWGGYSGGYYLNTGAMYFPDEDVWVSMPTANAPGARSGHAAIWTGKYYIVWGGGEATGQYNDGAMFDPETGIWTPISTVNAPSARTKHSLTWVDSGMIVWGGRGLSTLGDGSFWDITTDTWTPLTLTDAPDARENHYALYLPSRGLVIYGGSNSFQPLTDGAVYDPTAGTWTAIPGDGLAPQPYFDRSVALIGKYLFSWGGYFNGFNTQGAKFNLDSWEWELVTTTNQPSARTKASTAWTGSVVIIWGGQEDGGSTSSGSYYFP